MPTSSEGMTEFTVHFALLRFWNENVKCVFVDHWQNISTDKSKQTSTFLEIRNLNEFVLRCLNQVLSICLLI